MASPIIQSQRITDIIYDKSRQLCFLNHNRRSRPDSGGAEVTCPAL